MKTFAQFLAEKMEKTFVLQKIGIATGQHGGNRVTPGQIMARGMGSPAKPAKRPFDGIYVPHGVIYKRHSNVVGQK